MIKESAYIELMKNCSKWNSSLESERHKRYPFLDAQTAIAQRPAEHLYRNSNERFGPAVIGQLYTYPARVWQKQPTGGGRSSDDIEMKYFYQTSALLAETQNNANVAAAAAAAAAMEIRNNSVADEISNGQAQEEMPNTEKRDLRADSLGFEEDLDELSPEDMQDISDEDEWSGDSNRRSKRRKKPPPKRKPAGSASTTPADTKPYICGHCGAKYKSCPGLNYHKAHVHSDFQELDRAQQQGNQLISPTVDVSTFCDFCLGDRMENKKTGQAEDLVSCHDCGRSGHPTCLNFTSNMMVSTKKYGWQCIECKSCAICGTSENDDQLLFCDDCDRGFHLYCLNPRLPSAPEGEWSCHLCQVQFGHNASLPCGPAGPTSFPAAQQIAPVQ